MCVIALAMLWIGALWGDAIWNGVRRLGSVLPGAEDRPSEEGAGYWSCGMHPWVILPRRGICPICEMALTPLDPSKFTGEIAIDPVVVQNIGVRLDPVVVGPLTATLRTVGTVTSDERTVRDVSLKVGGWIETLHVAYVGAEVKRGEPLFELYSPELYAAQEEYLLALESEGASGTQFLPRAGRDRDELLRSARTRLEFFDMGEAEVRALEERGEPAKAVRLTSPHTGTVLEKMATEGMRVEPGMRLYRIADLSRVWVLATIHEFQIPYISMGQRAVVSLPYIPGQTFEGEVSYIDPTIDVRTREVKVRVEIENAERILKPGMFASVELRSTLAGERTLVARSAVLDTGERRLAFVSLGEGRFEPRELRIGVAAEGDRIEVLDGLKPGELVVTSGQFLIDSESKVREALSKMLRGGLIADGEASADLAGGTELDAIPEALEGPLVEALGEYFAIGDTLSRDTLEGVAEGARRLAAAADAAVKAEIPGRPHFWHEHTEAATIRGKALELVGEKDLAEARSQFADLSVALSKLLRATGVPAALGEEVQELRCPMYREGQGGGFWLQRGGEVRNPFFGSTMLRCFDRKATLPAAGAKERGAS